MDPLVLAPLGGASVLLIYLLRVWLIERAHWQKERARLQELWYAERQALVDLHRQTMKDLTDDHKMHLDEWRDRYEELRRDRDLQKQIQEEVETRKTNGGGELT